MIRMIEDRFKCNYKLSLNQTERTLRIWYKHFSERKYYKHLIAYGLTQKDIKDIKDNTDSDLLYWIQHDYQCTFSIWR